MRPGLQISGQKMSEEWFQASLGELVTIRAGKYIPKSDYVHDGAYWIYGSNSVMGRYNKALVDERHCIMAAVGAYAGASRYSEEPSWVNNNAFALIPNHRIDAHFLYLWLIGALDLRKILAGTGQPYVKRPLLLAQELFIPPLPVQRRIVDLMTHLDKQIVNLRRELDAAECLARAQRDVAFSNLLADSIAASDVFEMLLGRQKSAPQSVGAHIIPYIRAANISEQGLKLDDVQTMNFNPSEQERYCLRHDDVLLVEGGTVGLAARWSSEIPGPVGFDKHVIRLRAKPMSSCSEYAFQWAKWSRETGAFAAEATGITIKALGFGRACKMLVPNLALESQFEVCAPLSALENQISLLRVELSELESLRSVILGSLLSGKLELEEDVEHLEHQAMA